MESQHPETPGRLRVDDLGIDSERRLHLGGGFACVLTFSHGRSDAARWIAKTIVEPRPGDSGREIDGEPSVLDSDRLHAFWVAVCARRREALAAAHESHRSEQQRIYAELERLRAPHALPWSAEARRDPEADLDAFKSASQTYMRVQSLLATIDALQPEPSPEALEIADAWDENVALLQQPEEPGAADTIDVEAAQESVRADEGAEAPPSGLVGKDVAAELEQLHTAVVEAQLRIFGVQRGRRRLVARFNKAVAAERAALAEAGVSSYSAFLARLEERESPSEDRVRLAPDEETATAIDELHAATRARQVARHEELNASAQALLARARAFLGREPGDDLAGDLRAQRIEAPARADRIRELEEVLRAAGVEVVGDVMGHVRVFMASPPSVHIPQPPTWPMLVARPVVPLAEVEALEQQRVAQQELLDELEADIMRLDATRDDDLAQLAPDDFVRVIDAMFDAYRAGDVLEGRLPLVLDGVLDGLAADVRDPAVVALADADDVQVIVVTDDPEVTNCVSEAGGTIVRWPEPETPNG
jgi:hypothetical protein